MAHSIQQLVSAVREHAEANYNKDGWDFIVECWEDSDIVETIHGAETEEQAIALVKDIAEALDSRRADVESTIW